jgi:hypothetical protein
VEKRRRENPSHGWSGTWNTKIHGTVIRDGDGWVAYLDLEDPPGVCLLPRRDRHHAQPQSDPEAEGGADGRCHCEATGAVRSCVATRTGGDPDGRRAPVWGGYGRPMAHIRIGDKSWNVTDDAETVLRHLTSGETYVADLAGGTGALVISPTLNWAVVSAKQPAVDPAASAF